MFNKIYKVKYTTATLGVLTEVVRLDHGNLSSRDRGADKKMLLSEALKINHNQIISITLELGIVSDIKQRDMSVVLMSLYSAALSGENLIDSLVETLDDIYGDENLNNKLQQLKQQGLTIADIFKRLNAHPVIVEIIRSGERASNTAEAFDDANDFLSLDQETKKASKTGIGKSSIYSILGITLIFVVPIFGADFFNEILTSMKREVDNQVVDYFNFVSDNITAIIVSLLVLIVFVLFVIFNKQTYAIAKKLPVFRVFDRLSSIKRAIVFMPFYSALNLSGVNDKSIVQLYAGIDKEIAAQLYGSISLGVSLPEAIQKSNMPTNLTRHLSTVLKIQEHALRRKAFGGLIKLLTARALNEGKKISTMFNILGFCLILLGFTTIIFFYQTMLTISL